MKFGRLPRRGPAAWFGATLITLVPTVAAGQDPGYLAVWGDCEIRSAYLEASRETEVHLALQASGASGLMTVVFTARFAGREPKVAPGEVAVRVAAGYQTNPAAIRSRTLTFVLDGDTEDQTVIDLTGRVLTGRVLLPFPAPGAAIDSGLATMSLVEFVQLTRARTVGGKVLGLDVSLTDSQVDAIWRFAEKIFPKPRRR